MAKRLYIDTSHEDELNEMADAIICFAEGLHNAGQYADGGEMFVDRRKINHALFSIKAVVQEIEEWLVTDG